jgi:uncharacterized membrane protein YuzA (DUF378 family)
MKKLLAIVGAFVTGGIGIVMLSQVANALMGPCNGGATCN